MQSIPIQLPEILKYGIIGLGALLGVLTYFLISKEQGLMQRSIDGHCQSGNSHHEKALYFIGGFCFRVGLY
jgi:hypothetical protein